jgi:hypothetical protein
MINYNDVEQRGCGLILSHYPGICLESLRKATKNLSQDNRSPCQVSEPGTSGYEAGEVFCFFSQYLKADVLVVYLKLDYGSTSQIHCSSYHSMLQAYNLGY